MKKKFLAMMCSVICGVSMASMDKPFLETGNTQKTPSSELSFNGGKFLGCEILFNESNTSNMIFMHISNVGYYSEHKDYLRFDFNNFNASGGGTAKIKISNKQEKEMLLKEFIYRRNICSFSPLNISSLFHNTNYETSLSR